MAETIKYADVIEPQIKNASRDDLIVLLREMVNHAERERAAVARLIESIKGYTKVSEEVYQSAHVRYKVISTCAKQMARAVALSPVTDNKQREEIFSLVSDGLKVQADLGFVEIDWPDPATWQMAAKKES